MKRLPVLGLLALLALPPCSARAEEAPVVRKPSLIFTEQEVIAIEKAVNAFDKAQGVIGTPDNEASGSGGTEELPAVTQPNVSVSAVMDFGNGDWTVWANGYRIRPGHQAPGFTVVAVKDDLVDIVIPGDQEARVRLKSNQTWRARHRDVVEGSGH